MRLCSLEIQGFKSFPDKTYLEFDDGITAVVGPNGSGKSNIADAMRWVFGEQSTKTLRGGKMEDIIFSGTQARKSVGYASVKLTIEDKTNVEYNEDGKTTIGRRLYRSGESEYTINGSAVRLKDVTEFFMDTGMGRDGYSIIGQGRISEIVSAKSAQRREIFEEAAGIAKYRYRRLEAEKRLIAAEENLLRLKDILLELEERVGPLKIQSEKAKKYLIYSKERKDLEISLWVKRLEQLKESISDQQNNILIAKNDYELLQSESEANENQINHIYQQMQQLSVSVDEIRKSIRNLEEEKASNNAAIAVHKNNIQHNEDALARLIESIEGLNKGEGELDIRFKAKQVKKSELAEKATQIKQITEEKQKQIEDKKEEVQTLSRNLDGYLARQNSLNDSINQLKIERAASTSATTESAERLEEIKKNDNQYDKIILEYQLNIEECQKMIDQQSEQIASITNTKNGYLMKGQSREGDLSKLLEKHKKLESDISGTESRIKLLEDMEAGMDGYYGSVKYIINQSKNGALKGVHGPVSSIITTNPDYITAIEIAIGSAMQNIVVEDENTAKQGIDMLKRAGVGRATFLPLTSVKGKEYNFSEYENHHGFIGAASALVEFDQQFSGIIYQLLGRICIVDNLNTGTSIAKKAGYKFRVVTLDGQVINAGGSYTGGAVSRSVGILARRNEIDELKVKAKALTVKIKELEPSLKEIQDEARLIEATIIGADAEIRSAEEDMVRLGFSKEQLEHSLKDAITNSNLAKNEVDKLVERIKKLEEGQLTADQLTVENQAEIDKLKTNIDSTRDKISSLNIGNEATLREIQRYQMESLGLEKDLQSAFEEIARLKEQIANSDSELERINAEKESVTNANNSITDQIGVLEKRQVALENEIMQYNNDITISSEKRTNLEQQSTKLRQIERDASGKREGVSRELSKLEERQSTMQLEYDGIIEKMWDEYQLTRSMAVEIAKPVDDMTTANTRLTELRQKIRGLGSVNLEAVEEYSEVSERYEFLSSQIKDVDNSKAQLNALINELTDEMRVIFKDNFDKIAEEFSTTFVELFGGGKAELVLVDNEDVLEAGIEIRVQPPGKVIKNLSLLSGGEQAFVAIAIYFAILKVKPAPFVILDEIEAALDDVNVVRYARYLRSLSNNTQFIAITHRRGTMEEADIIYGVTMQENGISKLLELKVTEIENKLGMEAE